MDEMMIRDNAMKALIDVTYQPALKEEQDDVDRALKIPFGQLSALGAGFSSFPTAFRTVTQTVNTGASGLYRMVIPENAVGTLVQKNGVTLGNLVGADGYTFSARARFVQATESVTTTSTTLPINPATMFMAATLVSIEKKLDDIQETQAEILDFLKDDKKSKMRGSFAFLSDALENYAFHWNNSSYISAMLSRAGDCKREALQNIDFYREQITKIAGKRGLLVSDQEVKSRADKLQSEFKNYQLAVYLYGFASFLEVLSLQDFDSAYLDSVIKSIEDSSLQYRELYTKCYNKLESSAKSSLQKHLLNGVATVSGAAGETIAKIPLISKSQIDETLIESKKRLSQFSNARAEKMVGKLANSKDCGVSAFVESIKTVGRIYNEPVKLLFDSENLYLVS